MAFLLVSAAACPAGVGSLRLIGQRALPPGTTSGGGVVGGLSGLDYDAAADRWLAVSDDRAEHGPVRVFTLRLDYDGRDFRGVEVEGAVMLRQADGTGYPNRAQVAAGRRGDVPDLEALRLDPVDGTRWHASEGDRTSGTNPFVRGAGRDGSHLRGWPLPATLAFDPAGRRGPRPNLAIEGLTFAPDGGSLWVALEAPLIEDGPVASAAVGASVRFTRLARDGRQLAQVAYPVDPWPQRPAPGRPADNGVAEILAAPDGRLLVLERSGAQRVDGSWQFSIRIHLADVGGATDIGGLASLAQGGFRPASKRRLLDFADLGSAPVDNLEAMAWGRRLPNGHATLVLASDNNFLPTQQTQFWVFEVMPDSTPDPIR